MKKNVGMLDRILRIVGGLVIVSLAFWGPKSPWFYLGFLLVLTGICGYCPPYTYLGINTRKKEAAASAG